MNHLSHCISGHEMAGHTLWIKASRNILQANKLKMRSVLINKAFGICFRHSNMFSSCKIRQNIHHHMSTYAPRSQYQRDSSDPSTVLDDATADEIQVQESEAGLTLEGKSESRGG